MGGAEWISMENHTDPEPTNRCAYHVGCSTPLAYEVLEKGIGAIPDRVVFCCATHYPGNRIMSAPTERTELRAYVITPLDRA